MVCPSFKMICLIRYIWVILQIENEIIQHSQKYYENRCRCLFRRKIRGT